MGADDNDHIAPELVDLPALWPVGDNTDAADRTPGVAVLETIMTTVVIVILIVVVVVVIVADRAMTVMARKATRDDHDERATAQGSWWQFWKR